MIYGRTLGPPSLTVDGARPPQELLWRKHLALLVYLARSPRRSRTREHLVGLLWGNKRETAARHSLREAVRILRRAGGEDAVQATSRHVTLSDDAVRLDVDDLETLAAAEEWDQAAALVAGEFLEGLTVPDASPFEDWLAAERLHWRQRTTDVLVRAGDALLAQGRAGEATEAARRALALAPLSERAVGLILRAGTLAGDRAAALAEYEAFTGRLGEETGGTEPTAVLRQLVDRIRTGRLQASGRAAPDPATDSSRRAPLVGRETELARLAGLWMECAGGGGARLAVIQGDPGLGKTRLLEEVAARARLDGAATALVRAVPADTDTPDGGLLALADAGLVDAPGAPRARPQSLAALAQYLPAWAERSRVANVEPEPILHRAFRDVVEAVVEEQPLLLLVDDAQWVDTASLTTVEMLLRDLADCPLTVLFGTAAAAIPETLDRLRAGLGRQIAGTAIQLEPLDEAALRQLAAWALPAYAEDDLARVVRRVAADSAGFPLLAVELLSAIAQGLETDAARDTPWPRPARTLDQTLPGELPDTVVAAIRVGFRRLTGPAQVALQASALLGERFTAAEVARAADLAAEETSAALDELEWERWLTAEPRGYGFVARIVRQIVADDLLTAGQRRRMLGRLKE